jgi:alanine racemase
LRRNDIGIGGSGEIAGHKIPILGRVSMDLIALDVTDVPEQVLAEHEWIDLLNERITVDDVARSAGTIGYEILTNLGQRYERIYLGS